LSCTEPIYITGKQDFYSTINAAILELEINSLKHIERTLQSARQLEQPPLYDNEALDFLGELFAERLRPLYLKWLPSRIKDVDLCLKGIQELIPFKIGVRGEKERQREQAETFDEKLKRLSSIPDANRHEGELINFAFDVLNNRASDKMYSRDQMIDKILNAFNSVDNREFVIDAKIISGLSRLVKEKNFVQVAQEARRISRSDLRAQMLTGAATSLDKTDPEAAGWLYVEALNVLSNTKPGSAAIRTTLLIAERYFEKDPDMGRHILNSAFTIANQTTFSEKGVRFPFNRNIYGFVGDVDLILGFEPERIQDALRGVNIGRMAQSYWPATYETSRNIENKMFRAIFQLKMCEAIINQSSGNKPKV
jgi:hypothetical protein